MRCFRHPAAEAVGSCKSCMKGVCSECAVDLKHGVACRNSCEENVELLNQLMKKSFRMLRPLGQSQRLISLVFGGVSFLSGYLAFAVRRRAPDDSFWMFLTAGSVLFFLMALTSFRTSSAMVGTNDSGDH